MYISLIIPIYSPPMAEIPQEAPDQFTMYEQT
jgi:hypothetical protein